MQLNNWNIVTLWGAQHSQPWKQSVLWSTAIVIGDCPKGTDINGDCPKGTDINGDCPKGTDINGEFIARAKFVELALCDENVAIIEMEADRVELLFVDENRHVYMIEIKKWFLNQMDWSNSHLVHYVQCNNPSGNVKLIPLCVIEYSKHPLWHW